MTFERFFNRIKTKFCMATVPHYPLNMAKRLHFLNILYYFIKLYSKKLYYINKQKRLFIKNSPLADWKLFVNKRLRYFKSSAICNPYKFVWKRTDRWLKNFPRWIYKTEGGKLRHTIDFAFIPQLQRFFLLLSCICITIKMNFLCIIFYQDEEEVDERINCNAVK